MTTAFWTGGAKRRATHSALPVVRPLVASSDADLPSLSRPASSSRKRRRAAAPLLRSRSAVTSGRPASSRRTSLAEVELDEQRGLRLLTTIVDCDDVAIGMAVGVRFEPAGDAWDSGVHPVKAESRAVIFGNRFVDDRAPAPPRPAACSPWIQPWPQSATPVSTAEDIDGVSTYPGASGSTPGITGAGVDDVPVTARTELALAQWWHRDAGPARLDRERGTRSRRRVREPHSVLPNGLGVLRAGPCGKPSFQSLPNRGRESVQWGKPYGRRLPDLWRPSECSATCTTAARRAKQFAQLAVVSRTNAAGNPDAISNRIPMTVDDYLDVRMISDPLCLYDWRRSGRRRPCCRRLPR